MIHPTSLAVDYDPRPYGLDDPCPAFAWVPVSDGRAQTQSAYWILVASSADNLADDCGDVWDTGQVTSDQTAHVPYAGKPLESFRRYCWKVRLWDGRGEPSGWSEPAWFDVGLLSEADWRAEWIGAGPPKEPQLPLHEGPSAERAEKLFGPIPVDLRATLLRREWAVHKPVRRAMAYVCGLGYYVMYINGHRVGDYVMTPSKTDYRKQVLYDAYDVTALVRSGPNAVGLMLGNGWYNPPKEFWDWHTQWHGSKRAIMHLRIEYEDGTVDVVASDGSWRCAGGPVIRSCIYDGEVYDAREDLPGWDRPGFDDSQWRPVNVVAPPGGRLRSHAMPPIQVTETIRPKALWETAPGVFVFDMGQNFSGWCRLTVQGRRGTSVVLRHAENIHPDGTLDTGTNLRARNEDTFILKGGGVEVFEPHFTYHGFQYVEMTGFPGTPTLDTILGCVTHTANRQTGQFRCGNAVVNHVQHCTVWSQRSNSMGMPTDDNQRDERLGWMGDAHVTAEECMHNFDAARFYRKWLRDPLHGQDARTGDVPYISPRPEVDGTPCWSSAYPLIVWYAYQHYGDKRFLEEHLDALRRYVDFLGTTATDYILPRDRYGDHVNVCDNAVRGDPELATTFYYHYNAWIVSEAARVLGRAEMTAAYADLARRIRDAYQRRFFRPESRRYGQGSQCETAMTLALGLEPPEQTQPLLDHLEWLVLQHRKGHPNTGILGTKYLFDVLLAHDRNDVAWRIATVAGHPGFASMTEGRTTLSETWDQRGTNNHVMFGSVSHWFYRALAGIRALPDHPGFARVRIEPYAPVDLDWAAGSIETVRGRIASAWKRANRRFRLSVEIPANVTAEVVLPLKNIEGPVCEGATVVWDGAFKPGVEGVSAVRETDGKLILDTGSGRYEFECGCVDA